MTGAERVETQPRAGLSDATDWLGAPAVEERADLLVESQEDYPSQPRSLGLKLFGALLILLALGWIGAAGWSVWQTKPALNLDNAVGWAATFSGPLILIALLWLWLGRSSRRETERFSKAVAELRAEGIALESVLAIVAGRLEENHARLRGEAERLMSLGDEASDRLGRVTHYLAKESVALDKGSTALENAAAAAKVDIGVLLHDLPRAEEQARSIAEAMKDAGLAAHGQAGALEAQLAALTARGREADEVVGGGAQRLAAHVARIESSSASAAAGLEQASSSMSAAVDGAMTKAAEAIDAARSGLEAQGAAMLAAVEQSRSAFDRAGEDTARSLGARLDMLSGKIETLAGHLAAQDAASHALVSGLGKELTELDAWFARLGDTGTAQSAVLSAQLGETRETTRQLVEEIQSGNERAGELIGRAQEMTEALSAVAGQLDAATGAAPAIDGMQASAEAAAARVGEVEASIARQREALDSLLARLDEGVTGAEQQLQRIGAAAADTEGTAARIVAETGPQLVESLIRVREAANQAAERAREAIAAVIPASAAALAEAGRQALGVVVDDSVGRKVNELSELSRRAVNSARDASERLTRQMLALGEAAGSVETRIELARREREEHESENFSRRVALLIELLNSTAIDVTKILSNEVTDSAWAAYLKGDRGVFTRRAVRLIDNTEAREIVRHYEEEAEFREQVNRYIHDFEAMLRRILADRDGSPLGITILSSDMGKLYVALAQAIERLRN